MSLVDSISQAIATMEGYFTAGSVAQRQNNPGNLRSWGTNPIVNGYAQFPTAEAGWSALNRQVSLNIDRGLTLQEFFAGKPGVYAGYSPGADANDPAGYSQYVADQVGISPTVPLNSLTLGIPEGSNLSEAGMVDFGTLAVLGLIGLGLWWYFD